MRALAEAMDRPASSGERLGAWDDLPVHQTAAPLGDVQPAQAGWAERFYFNVLRPSGEIAAIVGGGVYPRRGVSECYACRLAGERQSNLRVWDELPRPGRDVAAGPFSFRCDEPLRDWTVEVDVEGARFGGRFAGVAAPYLFSAFDVPASEPGGEFDLYRHFVAVGRWELDALEGLDTGGEELIGVRDRTWGVRTRRIRLHNWYVFRLGEAVLTLIHQERADGSVFFSEAGVVRDDGHSERLEVVGHALRYDPQSREIVEGRVDLRGGGGPLCLEYERIGRAMRLAGAGYDAGQGDRRTASGMERDEYDLADPDVARTTGRGTMDAGARGRVTGAWDADGIGVVETAVARDHLAYGAQIA